MPLSRIDLQIDLGPAEPLRAFTLFFFRNFKAKFGPRLGLEPFFAYLFARVRTLEGEIGRLAPPQEDASRDSNGGLAP